MYMYIICNYKYKHIINLSPEFALKHNHTIGMKHKHNNGLSIHINIAYNSLKHSVG